LQNASLFVNIQIRLKLFKQPEGWENFAARF